MGDLLSFPKISGKVVPFASQSNVSLDETSQIKFEKKDLMRSADIMFLENEGNLSRS